MTDAIYSNGDEFHYEYDAVGNILTKVVKLSGITTTTTYTYDDANRLLTVNGVAQQFDANGNLINDGAKTYAYDSANRLKSITQGANVSTYAYNGLNDRVSQTNNGVTTNYSLDLNAGLTQVLSDGTNTYLYGLGRIGEQQPSGFAYHLGDALGSVRQLVDVGGVIQLTRSYEPYGETLSSTGSGNSVYQYTGEARDSQSGLTYLRARYYNSDGRFLSRDSWGGDIQTPATMHGWGYVHGNPINFTDHSGRCLDVDPKTGKIFERIPFAPAGKPCPGSALEVKDSRDLNRLIKNYTTLNQGPCEIKKRSSVTIASQDEWQVLLYRKDDPLFEVTVETNIENVGTPEMQGALQILLPWLAVQPDAKSGLNMIHAYGTDNLIEGVALLLFGDFYGKSANLKYDDVEEITASGGVSGGIEGISEWGIGYEHSFTRQRLSGATDSGGYIYAQKRFAPFGIRYEGSIDSPLYAEVSFGLEDLAPLLGIRPSGIVRGIGLGGDKVYYIAATTNTIERRGGYQSFGQLYAPRDFKFAGVVARSLGNIPDTYPLVVDKIVDPK